MLNIQPASFQTLSTHTKNSLLACSPHTASASDIQKLAANPSSGAGVKVGENVSTAMTKLNNGNLIPSVSILRGLGVRW